MRVALYLSPVARVLPSADLILTLALRRFDHFDPPSDCCQSVMERSSDAAEEKRHEEWIEATLGPVHTNIENSTLAALSREHREYLAQRHGTLELDPIPDANDADPYNWPQSRVSNTERTSPKHRALLTTT